MKLCLIDPNTKELLQIMNPPNPQDFEEGAMVGNYQVRWDRDGVIPHFGTGQFRYLYDENEGKFVMFSLNSTTMWDDETSSWVTNKVALMDSLRGDRNGRLMNTDWTQLSDAPISADKKQEYATYRQALRDLPANSQDAETPGDIVWPTEPS